jgi:uncharacterized protein (TIGR02145 family)
MFVSLKRTSNRNEMLMKIKAIIVIMLIIVCTLTLSAQEYVAVLEFDGSGMSKIEARNVTERFSYELSQTRKFNIIERQQLDLILNEQKTQLSGCVADECAVQIGELAGARYVIAGSVTKTFGLYGIAVRLIDVESGEIITHILESDEADVQKFVSQRVRNAALRMAAEGGSTNGQSGGSTVTVSSGEKGSIVFTLNKSGAAVYVDNEYTTQASSQTVSLNLTEGTHQIKFTLPGQQDWVKQLNVLANETLNYEVTFESGTGSGGVAIDYGIVMVRSEPSGAIAYLDGVELGPTPAQNTKVGVGKHLIRVEKPMYYPYVEEITITADGIEQVQAKLKPRFGRLVINSVPPGAVVQLNGQQKGKTPIDLPELASGDYTITVSKDLHHDSVAKYTITDGSNNERTIVLHPAFGQLSVEANPKGADVFVDGQFKGKAPINLDELPSGTFRLKVSQALYETLDEEIIIEDGKANKQFVVLSPRFGTLIITGSPESAQVSINGKAVGPLPLVNHRVGTGLAEIKVSAKNYHGHEQFIQVDVNEMYPVKVDLVRHSGTVVAISDPPEALLRLDGVEIGPSPQILKKIPTGKHSLVFAHPEFLEEIREFNLELDERKEYSVKLVTYEGSIHQDIDRLVRYRNLSLVGSGGFALGALAMKMMSNNTYDDYKVATDSDELTNLFDEANSLNQMSTISLGVAIASLAPALYHQIGIGKLRKRLLRNSRNDVFNKIPAKSNNLGLNTVQDIDGNTYKTVQIGNQVWMAENLKVTHYRNGEQIPRLSSRISWLAKGILGMSKKGVYCSYDNDDKNIDSYGYLYNGYAIEDKRVLAPEGWHVATEDDWQELEFYLGMNDLAIDSMGYRGSNEGSKLAGSNALWSDGSLENNTSFGSSGFVALPGGGRDIWGKYIYTGRGSLFWSATRIANYALWMRAASNDETDIYRGEADLWAGMSVRCVKD